MKILVIGGTQFIGKHFVTEAVRRGHEVTLFNRGSKPAPAGVADEIRGDRNTDLGKLAGRSWDAVVDTSAYVPRQVREAARLLEGSVERYLFISTISVYADTNVPLVDESAELIRLDDPSVEEVTGETYGGLKVLCEEELAAVYPPERSFVVRPGIVVGPEDPTDRFTYWPVRVARGGEVLAPHGPDLPLQWIDARDLALWMMGSLDAGRTGTYNAISQAGQFDMGTLLQASALVTSADADFTWVGDEFLLEQGVRPFADLPFWLPGADANLFRIDARKAFDNGLSARPVEETVKDTLTWQRERGAPELKIGLSLEREREVLDAWRRSGAGADATG